MSFKNLTNQVLAAAAGLPRPRPGLALLAESFAIGGRLRSPKSADGQQLFGTKKGPLLCHLGAIHSDPLDVGLFVDILNEAVEKTPDLLLVTDL